MTIRHADRVRAMSRQDLELVLGWRNHPEIRRYMYTTHEISLAEHTAWFERASQDPRRHLLVFESGGEAVGYANLNLKSHGVADWGFYVGPHAAKGAGSRLGRAVLDHAFGALGLHKVCGEALEFNNRSISFHERLGFRREGTLRDQHHDGERYWSVVVFGMLDAEWTPTSQ